MTSFIKGRQKWQEKDLGKLLSIENAVPAIFDLVKRKDYNRIVARLRNYHSLALFLHTPPINNLAALSQVHSTLSDLEISLREIELSVDQISDDCHSMGLREIEDTFQGMVEVLKISHDYLNKQVREALHSEKAEHFKFKRNSKNLCEECFNSHEAVHLRRLKTSFGCDFPDREVVESKKNEESVVEDLAMKEKDDFISQLDYLLEKKSSVSSLVVNTRRYKELVDVLSKMEMMESIEKKKFQEQREEEQNEAEEDEELFGNKYKQVVEEVKKILNLRFREGYSHRIRNMLDKFEVVFKSEHMRIAQKKNLINMVDKQIQTLPTAQGAQIELLKEELASKDNELLGIAEGRKRIQQKYLRLLQAQRKISREANANASKNEQLVRTLEQKEKNIQSLNKKLGISIQKVDYHFETDRGQYSNRNNGFYRHEEEKQRHNQLRNIQLRNCESQTESQSFDLLPIEHRKKNLRMYKKASMKMATSKLINSLSISEQVVNQPVLSLISNLIEISINQIKSIKMKKKVGQSKGKSSELDENDASVVAKKKKGSNKSKKGKPANANSKKVLPNQSRQGFKYVKSIEQLNKQSQDEVIDELSQGSADSPSNQSFQRVRNNRISIQARSSRFLLPLRRESRDFQAISSIRLTDMSKTFRLNHIKTDVSKPKDEVSIQNNKQKDGSIVRIERYAKKKSSGSIDKDRVREIVNLLKVQREVITKKSNFKPHEQSSTSGFPQVLTEQKSQQQHQIQIEPAVEERQECEHQNIGEVIESLKIIIQSEYSYLKASGFIGFLLSFDRKPSLLNRNLIKYRFQFTHIGQSDLELFGGLEEMIKFSRRVGIWQKYVQDESDLKLYYKHINFAHKISKYFLLLKKMNPEYFEEYVGFITDPLGFSNSRFSPQIRQQIGLYCVEDEQKEVFPSNQSSWKRVMMRLIRFHHDAHKNCKHIVEFLDKIGYYRYSI